MIKTRAEFAIDIHTKTVEEGVRLADECTLRMREAVDKWSAERGFHEKSPDANEENDNEITSETGIDSGSHQKF